MSTASLPFGAILAGGRSVRYGSPKALATVAGESILDRVRRALLRVTPDLILIANEPSLFAGSGLPTRPDARPGLGALGGIHAALLWAREAGRPGILAVACDMPFLDPALLVRILERAAAGDVDVVAPESGGRRGVEPLCAYYGTGCIPAIEAAFDRGDRHVIGFFDDVRVRSVPLDEVRAFGDPERLFMNVNTPEERELAERLAGHPVVDSRRLRPDWLGIREALDRILAAVAPLPSERVPILEAAGRVLAESVVSPIDQPPWDNSAMDGFAVRSADVRGASRESPARLRVVDEIPAGAFPRRPLGPGEAARIMTGAPIPEGADSVIRLEHTDAWTGSREERGRGSPGETVEVFDDSDVDRNVRRRGEDLRRGETVLEPGRVLRPGEIGLLATVGRAEVAVHRRPRVAILANGDELVDLDRFDEVRAGRRIVNSNSYGLAAAVRAAGAEPLLLGIAADDAASLRAHLERAREADLLITTAGASVGDHDLVKEVLESLGFALDFWRVRMRPGSPFSFGRLGDLPVFGLAGNPVSALVTFEVLVRPAIRKMLGRREIHAPTVRAVAAERIPGAGRLTHFPRARLEPDGRGGWLARLTGPQGSGILTSVAAADALLVVPEGIAAIEPGEPVVALPLPPPDPAAVDFGVFPESL
jgi:molybdopterin molybdotransferase